jgi:DNA-binding beta-propeller fold protein YncE
MMLVVLSHSEQKLSASAGDSALLPPPFDVNEIFGNSCPMPSAEDGDMAASAYATTNSDVIGGDIAPVRQVTDPYPSFNGIAVDGVNGVVFMSDANRKGLLLYDRASGSRSKEETRKLGQITGPATLLGYVAGVALDPDRREVYGVNNDIEDSMMVFSYDDTGDVKPKRVLGVPHGAYGLSFSKKRDEIAMTIQDTSANAVVIYKRDANGLDPPVRVLRGKKTDLSDPHGIDFDDTNQELIVTNWGSWNVPVGDWYSSPDAAPPRNLPGGTFNEPSINAYSATAEGEVPPLRKIQGAATQLNWPTGLDVDPISNEIVVANNGDNSVLVFPRTGRGDLKPSRILRGARTGINRPMGVAVDWKNNELWVANFGDHTAVVFDLKSTGNVRPKRVIRNAPSGTPISGFGNPMTVAYDPKRDELLVPN